MPFVLQPKGGKKQYHLMSAFLCALSDVILISGGESLGWKCITEPIRISFITDHLGRCGFFYCGMAGMRLKPLLQKRLNYHNIKNQVKKSLAGDCNFSCRHLAKSPCLS